MNVENALPKSCTGMYANASIFTAAANAAITAAPKLFTSPCTIKMPRFITDCCTQVKMEYPAISRIRLAWMDERLHSARSCGHLMSA